ncbi:MAG TPA: serine/threonine-protein kinase [Kofleriaceae bacterium]|nr:serine/threonine-protein kinase [Kofleriaceae bacterium]
MIVDPSAATAAEPNAQRATASAGETLGKYRLDHILGAGGMGIVWAAFDPDLERAVALKLLHSNDEPTLRSRLLREARAMARLKHPNVLTVYEVGTDKNRDYIAMEIVDGTTLDAWLDTKPPRPEIVEALLAAGRGLAAAHAAGLVHRDFKPHNVLRSKDGHVYVTDFGLARGQIEDGSEVEHRPVAALPEELGAARKPVDVLISPLTQTGVMIGTPAYMAPEQFSGRVPDARTDQWAFCVTAWEALTGARPYRGTTLPELEAAANAGVAALVVDLPPRVRDVLARGLDPDPAARFADMKTLLAAFAAAFAPAPRTSRRWLFAAIVAAAAIGGTIAIVAAVRGGGATADDELCKPADVAFGEAWSPARREAISRAHPDGDPISAIVILDEVRRRWILSYNQVCSAKQKTPEVREKVACLLQARSEIDRTTLGLTRPGARYDIVTLASLTAAVQMCTNGNMRLPGKLDLQLEDFEPGDIPAPPRPPTPPTRPAP